MLLGQRVAIADFIMFLFSIGRDCNSSRQITLDGFVIASTKRVVDLGVQFDEKLNCSAHIAKIVAKAHRRACLIQRCFLSRDKQSLVTALSMYVRPTLIDVDSVASFITL